MLTALLTFFGVTAFRLIFGFVMEYVNRRSDQTLVIERMNMQAKLDAQKAAQSMALVRLQAELGVKQIEVQSAADMDLKSLDIFGQAVRATTVQTGIKWVDAWNAAIRPALATIATMIIVFEFVHGGFVANQLAQTIIAGAIGMFVGERIDAKIFSRRG